MRREGALLGLLLAGMLLPVWIGRYAPLVDYPNHLLEAAVAAHYTDPHLGYAEGYELRPAWYLGSNALSTLVMIELGRVMPMALAGHLALSLYLILFLSGLWRLLRRSETVWPLLLLAPTLAYNLSFTIGWLNFCYGAALGMHALAIYLRWQIRTRWRDLLWLAFLLLLTYFAHVMAWALVLTVIAAMTAVETWRWARHGALLLALNGALPFLFITHPVVAVVAALIGPVVWSAAAVFRHMKIRPLALALSAAVIVGLAAAVIKLLRPLRKALFPEIGFSTFNKVTIPLRLFTLPHQFGPLSALLTTYNLTLLALIMALGGLLLWISLREPNPLRGRWLTALGILGSLYVVLPSSTHDLFNTEPRVLLFAVLVALVGVRLPKSGLLRQVVTAGVLALCLLSVIGILRYAQVYEEKTRSWGAQLDQLTPARNVLVLNPVTSGSRPILLRLSNTFYSGVHFSNVYALEHGGFVSRIFDNGPVRPRPTIPIPLYFWSGFDNAGFISERCADLRAVYEAVLVWGAPGPELAAQLDACFGARQPLPDMTIWRRAAAPGGGP